MPAAVIDHAPLGGKRNLPLLLVLGLLHKAAIAEDLQIDQPPADRRAPEQKHRAQQVKPGILARIGVIGHDYPNALSFRRCAKRRGGTCFLPAPANSRFRVAFALRNDKSLVLRQTWRTTGKADRQESSGRDGSLARPPSLLFTKKLGSLLPRYCPVHISKGSALAITG